jgi:small basic protein (TIGR04137 family)
MTMDRTLKVHGGLLRARSVLTRAERIARLMEEGKFDPEEDSPLGLPKVRVKTSKAGSKKKDSKEEAEEELAAEAGAEGAEAAPE